MSTPSARLSTRSSTSARSASDSGSGPASSAVTQALITLLMSSAVARSSGDSPYGSADEAAKVSSRSIACRCGRQAASGAAGTSISVTDRSEAQGDTAGSHSDTGGGGPSDHSSNQTVLCSPSVSAPYREASCSTSAAPAPYRRTPV
ncbi:hypothetical protein ACWEWP_32980, partial [Streptomyces olivaceus]